jgi:hypothetical protein
MRRRVEAVMRSTRSPPVPPDEPKSLISAQCSTCVAKTTVGRSERGRVNYAAWTQRIRRNHFPLLILVTTTDELRLFTERYGAGWRGRFRGVLDTEVLRLPLGAVERWERRCSILKATLRLTLTDGNRGRCEWLWPVPGTRLTPGTGTRPPGFHPSARPAAPNAPSRSR